VSTNEQGLRERPIETGEHPDELRILCLGDSWTYGQGVPAERTFARRFEAALQQRYPRYKVCVINGGQPGYSYLQGYYLADRLLALYHPQYVVVCGFNEGGNRQITEMEISLPDDSWRQRLMAVLHQSRLYLRLRTGVAWLTRAQRAAEAARAAAARAAAARAAAVEEARKHHIQLPEDRFLADAVTLRYARGIAAKARASGASCIFFNHAFRPLKLERHGKRYLTEVDDAVLGQLHEPGVATVTICPVESDQEHAAYMQPQDPVHPNEMGHQAMGYALAELFEDIGAIQVVTPSRGAP
jgi:lysophospholipase L1-like esterase